MMLGAPQEDPVMRELMQIGREVYPRSALTSHCTLGCEPYRRGCADVDMPQLRRLKESKCIDEIPGYDPFTILVDGKYKPGPGGWAVGIVHPFSGAARWMSGVEESLVEGSAPCGSDAESNQGQVQMAVEHLAISVGAKWFWSNLEFLSAAHAKYCVDGELPEYTIFSDTTTWFAAVERYFNDPTVASLAGEYNSLRSLAARLECLAMRASAVNVYHRYTEPL